MEKPFYLVLKSGGRYAKFKKRMDAADHLGVRIDDSGMIHINDRAIRRYVLKENDPKNGFTREQALQDFMKTCKEIEIYRIDWRVSR